MKKDRKMIIWYIIAGLIGVISVSVFILLISLGQPAGVIAIGAIFILLDIAMWCIIFSVMTVRYPKNDINEYFCDFNKADFIGCADGNYIFKVIRNGNSGVWTMHNGQIELRFDMDGYLFPKAYICTYFIRNIHYITLNALHLPFDKLFASLKLHSKNRYKNVELIFIYGKKEKHFKIVLDGKSRVSFLQHFILQAPYLSLRGRRNRVDGHMNDFRYKLGGQ